MGLIFLTSMTGTARAECVPLPDCASIGYTATSCDGDSIKCPFDISKLYCLPCDTKYKYTCIGDNISGGTGSSCGGKYVSCTCSNGEWDNESGTCKASCSDTSCSVGNILYSDMTCCKDVLSNKTAIGVVVKDNELVMSEPVQMKWSSGYYDLIGLTDISTYTKAEKDVEGRNNTTKIVSEHSSSGLTVSNSSAMYCNRYIGGGDSTEEQWYLPAYGELYSYVYDNYSKLLPNVNILSWVYFENSYFWSSSEQTSTSAWFVSSSRGFIDDYIDVYRKSNIYSVSCFLPISVNNGEVEPCGSEYKYRCSGEGESGSGISCGGYYKQCS